MINNVDEHPIPPLWRHEKLIRLKTGCHATPLYTFSRCLHLDFIVDAQHCDKNQTFRYGTYVMLIKYKKNGNALLAMADRLNVSEIV